MGVCVHVHTRAVRARGTLAIARVHATARDEHRALLFFFSLRLAGVTSSGAISRYYGEAIGISRAGFDSSTIEDREMRDEKYRWAIRVY